MPSQKAIRIVTALTLISACGIWLTAATGCGSKAKTPETQAGIKTSPTAGSKNTTATKKPDEAGANTVEKTTPAAPDNSEVNVVSGVAIASARSNNPELGELDVLGVKIVGSWARVDLQPRNKSTDGASWLLKKTNGKWIVMDFGTSIMPSDYPDAPAQVFQ